MTTVERSHISPFPMPIKETSSVVVHEKVLQPMISQIALKIKAGLESEDAKGLWSWQKDGAQRIADDVHKGFTEGIVIAPSRTGKTRLMIKVAHDVDLPCIIVVPSNRLVQQTKKASDRYPDLDVGIVNAYHKEYGRKTIITTYSSFVNAVESGEINPQDYPMLILDEVHEGLSEKRKNAIRKFGAIKIGFTATPEYSPKKKVSDLMPHEFLRRSLKEAADSGQLAPWSTYYARVHADLSKVHITSAGDYNQKQLDREINIESLNKGVVSVYKETKDDKGRRYFDGLSTIAFVNTVSHAENLAKLFNENGIASAVIHNHQTPRQQDEILSKFEEGEIKVVCNARIMTRGIDTPATSVVFNVTPTISRVLEEQRSARCLTLDPKNPQKHAYVVDFLPEKFSPSTAPVTFAQILKEEHIFPKVKSSTRDYPEKRADRSEKQRIVINGITVVTEVQEVYSIASEIQKGRSKAPEGWLSANAISKRLNINRKTVRRYLQTYLKQEEYATDNGVFPTKNGSPTTFYSLIIYKELEEKFASWEKPPVGWQNNYWLERNLGIGERTGKRYKAEIRKAHPEWIGNYLDHGGSITEHISPEGIAFIQKNATARIPSPVGWRTDSSLIRELNKLGIYTRKAREIISSLENEMKDDWGEYFSRNRGGNTKYRSPQFKNAVFDRIRALKGIGEHKGQEIFVAA